MSHKSHYDYVPRKAGTHFPEMVQQPAQAQAQAVPAGSSTQQQLPGAQPTAAKMGAAASQSRATVDVKVTQQAAAVVQEGGDAPASAAMLGAYKRYEVVLPDEVWRNAGTAHKLFVWLPKRDSPQHYVTRSHYATVTPDVAHARVKMGARELNSEELSDIRTVIQKMNAQAIQSHPDVSEAVLKAYLEKGVHWDFVALGTPVIEAVTWEKVANKCQFHSVGISIDVVDAQGQVVTDGQKKLRQISYVDPNGQKEDRNFQVIIEPALSNVMQSDAARHQGALLLQDHGAYHDPFIVNTTVEDLQRLVRENAGSTTRVMNVNLHDLHILWGILELPVLLSEYCVALKAEGGDAEESAIVGTRAKNTTAIIEALEYYYDNPQLTHGEEISGILCSVAGLLDNKFNGKGLFKMEMTDQGPKYRMPKILWEIILKAYISRAKKHQVFNEASELQISGTKLSINGKETYQEEETAVAVVQFMTKYYFPKRGHCYMRADFVSETQGESQTENA